MKTPEFATDNNVGCKAPENVPETNVGKINGRTPDEIKQGLEYCHSSKPCIDCKYDQRDFPFCVRRLLADAINGYEQLESRLAQVERERDAAVADARDGTMCDTCKHNNSKDYPNKPCYKCDEAFSYWEWRGICSKNTKEG